MPNGTQRTFETAGRGSDHLRLHIIKDILVISTVSVAKSTGAISIYLATSYGGNAHVSGAKPPQV